MDAVKLFLGIFKVVPSRHQGAQNALKAFKMYILEMKACASEEICDL